MSMELYLNDLRNKKKIGKIEDKIVNIELEIDKIKKSSNNHQ